MRKTVNNNSIDLSHLTPSAQIAAMLPDTERIHKIRSDRWIGYTQAHQALAELESLLLWPDRQRMQNMLLLGETNNGKTMIIEKFRRQHLPKLNENGSKEIIPVVSMQMPSDPSIGHFYAVLLHTINAPFKPRSKAADLEKTALHLLKETNVRMLIIDELHNVLAGGPTARQEFLNLLRFLGNELRIPIIGVGTADAYRAIRSDPQLENRFKPFPLPRWQNDNEVMALLASFATSFPLRRPSDDLLNQEIARYILARTEGTIGEISTFLTAAAIAAIETGEDAINNKTLAIANYNGPTERRQKFEREIL